MWDFESQGGSICVAFCDAIPLSANTAIKEQYYPTMHSWSVALCILCVKFNNGKVLSFTMASQPRTVALTWMYISSLTIFHFYKCWSVIPHMSADLMVKKGRVIPYSLQSVGSRSDPSVQAVSPQVSYFPAVGCRRFPPGLHFTFLCVHHMAPPQTKVTNIQFQLTTYLSTQKGWKAELAWLLTYSRWFTHISGHPSATGRAPKYTESSPARDRPSTAVPHNQPWYDAKIEINTTF